MTTTRRRFCGDFGRASLAAWLGAELAKLGDVYRHVVLVPKDRLWLPEMNRGAEVFAAGVVMHGPEPASLTFDRLPYRIEIGS